MNQTLKVFKALADETRLRIMNLILERDCCVCEVTQALDISQTGASRGLTQLYEAGLLSQRREGLWVIYHLAPDLADNGLDHLIKALEYRFRDDRQMAVDRRKLHDAGRLCPPDKLNPDGLNAECAGTEPEA
ncbi:transcriptional regulator, ArsR family [Dehalogenimonas lykanthroporepellens BL-DC-9]|nr:transcriptional regulator, ArsR family [Dehalogenimonas lykanthroporepellens BL-DC-9]